MEKMEKVVYLKNDDKTFFEEMQYKIAKKLLFSLSKFSWMVCACRSFFRFL